MAVGAARPPAQEPGSGAVWSAGGEGSVVVIAARSGRSALVAGPGIPISERSSRRRSPRGAAARPRGGGDPYLANDRAPVRLGVGTGARWRARRAAAPGARARIWCGRSAGGEGAVVVIAARSADPPSRGRQPGSRNDRRSQDRRQMRLRALAGAGTLISERSSRGAGSAGERGCCCHVELEVLGGQRCDRASGEADGSQFVGHGVACAQRDLGAAEAEADSVDPAAEPAGQHRVAARGERGELRRAGSAGSATAEVRSAAVSTSAPGGVREATGGGAAGEVQLRAGQPLRQSPQRPARFQRERLGDRHLPDVRADAAVVAGQQGDRDLVVAVEVTGPVGDEPQNQRRAARPSTPARARCPRRACSPRRCGRGMSPAPRRRR